MALVLAASFALSRILFYASGVRFDCSPLTWFWQYLDVDVLKHRLFAGLLHLHAQPPGFNLVLGTVVKLCPAAPCFCFAALYLLLGFMLFVALYRFLQGYGLMRPAAWLCALLFLVSPTAVLHENWLFYTYPVAVLLALAALALLRFQQTLRPLYAALYLGAVTAVCLMRASYHLIFLLACVGLVLLPAGLQRRRVAWCSLGAVSVVAAVYVKNLVLFGFFGASSWMGMNLFNIAAHGVETNAVAQLVQSGEISTVAAHPPFWWLDGYPQEFRNAPPDLPTRPELTAPRKASGEPNFNNGAYIGISREYKRSALYLIRHYPRQYAAAVFDAWLLYGQPSWHNGFLQRNAGALARYLAIFSTPQTAMRVNVGPIKRLLSISRHPTSRTLSPASSYCPASCWPHAGARVSCWFKASAEEPRQTLRSSSSPCASPTWRSWAMPWNTARTTGFVPRRIPSSSWWP